jgi:hypothetical protein
MAIIKLQRTSEWNARFRDYKIFIDGQQVGTIANGETKEFTTTSGMHTIAAKIDWCISPDLTVNADDNQAKSVKVSGFKHGNWMMPAMMGLVVLVAILKLTLNL